MPAPARKTARAKSAAEAAATEVATEVAVDVDNGDITVDFRGERFVITGDTRRSFRYAMAVAANNGPQMIYELIGPDDKARFIATASPGEAFADVATDFFDALGEATGEGNS